MSIRRRSLLLTAASLTALAFRPAWTAEVEFSTWLAVLRAEAIASGIRPATVAESLAGIEPIERILELDRKQPETTMSFDEYLARIVNDQRAEEGRLKLDENRALLGRVADRFGVQPRFVVALWGIETNFGRNMGGFSVIAALATLAYDGRRAKFFRDELLNALRIVDQGHITASAMKGSWAGAMGQSQFMPSSFLSFAVDFDGDGRIDIWSSRSDVFASAANYLAKSGWHADQTWGREVMLPDRFDTALADLKIVKNIPEWTALGLKRADGNGLPARDLPASIVLPGGQGGRAFIVYDNYRTIMKWNRSTYFATAVGVLADRIGD